MSSWTFEASPKKMISTNSSYCFGVRGGRSLTHDANSYKRDLRVAFKKCLDGYEIWPDKNSTYSVSLYLSCSWFTKANKIRVKDCENYSKLILDSLSEVIAVDDSHTFELHIYKVESQIEHVRVVMETL